MGHGQSSCPNILIESIHGFNNYVSYATGGLMGHRKEMEDAHISKCQMATGMGCFAVFDGHGGSNAVNHAVELFASGFFDVKEKKLKEDISSDDVIKRKFLEIDKQVCGKLGRMDMSGTTFIGTFVEYNVAINESPKNSSESPKMKKVVISTSPKSSPKFKFPAIRAFSSSSLQSSTNTSPKELYPRSHSQPTNGFDTKKKKKEKNTFLQSKDIHFQVTIMNAGDSRGILCHGSQVLFASKDHKPTDLKEKSRINRAGFDVIQGRIDGMLAVSRGFGDKLFKSESRLPLRQQPVTPVPVITRRIVSVEKSKRDLFFMVLACDGVYDVMTNAEVAQFVNHRLNKFDIYNTKHAVPRSEWISNPELWCYVPVDEWTNKQFHDWLDSVPEEFKDLIPRKFSSGSNFRHWIIEQSKRKSKSRKKFSKLYRYIKRIDLQIRKILSRPDPQTTSEKIRCITELLLHACVLEKGSMDNVTATIMCFHHPKWVQESAILMKQRLKTEKT